MTKESNNGNKFEPKDLRPKKTPPPGATYEVGYARTPEHGKFKKGQSGNPRGRPKESKNSATILEECLNEKFEVNFHGTRKRMTVREAIIRVQINNALKGDVKAFKEISAKVEKYGLFKTGPQRTGVLVAQAPMSPEEYMRLFGKAAQGAPIPQDVRDMIDKRTKKKQD